MLPSNEALSPRQLLLLHLYNGAGQIFISVHNVIHLLIYHNNHVLKVYVPDIGPDTRMTNKTGPLAHAEAIEQNPTPCFLISTMEITILTGKGYLEN